MQQLRALQRFISTRRAFCVALITLLLVGFNYIESWPYAENWLEIRQFSPIEKILEKHPASDAASYIRYAQAIGTQKSFHVPASEYWPPGFALVSLLVIKLTHGHYYPFIMGLSSALLWLLLLLNMIRVSRKNNQQLGLFLLIPLLLMTPELRVWTFAFGSITSESSSLLLFALSLYYLTQGLSTSKRSYFIKASLVLCLASYFRTFYDFVGVFTSFLFILLIGLDLIFNYVFFLGRKNSNLGIGSIKSFISNFSLNKKNGLITAMIAILCFHLVQAPWKLDQYRTTHHYQMSSIGQFHAQCCAWTRETASFAITTNTACILSPKLCDWIADDEAPLTPEEKQSLMVYTFFTHTKKWVKYKLDRINWLWYGRSWDELRVSPWIVFRDSLPFLLFIATAGAALTELKRRRLKLNQRNAVLFLAALSFCFLASNFGIFMFSHFETRYSTPLKIFFILIPWMYSKVRKAGENHL